jgi:hypothetical protein
VIGLQPPERPEVVPPTGFARARVGDRWYEGWASAEPSGPETVRWRMTWRVLDGDAGDRLLEERAAETEWWTVGQATVVDELARAGLHATPGEGGLVVARRAADASRAGSGVLRPGPRVGAVRRRTSGPGTGRADQQHGHQASGQGEGRLRDGSQQVAGDHRPAAADAVGQRPGDVAADEARPRLRGGERAGAARGHGEPVDQQGSAGSPTETSAIPAKETVCPARGTAGAGRRHRRLPQPGPLGARRPSALRPVTRRYYLPSSNEKCLQ